MASSGAGQQDPSDSVGPFNPHAFAFAQALAGIATIRVVKVLAVDTSAAHTVDVQIAVNQLDGQDNATPHGTINGIPYAWAMGGKNAFQVDPAVGDMGVMLVSDRDISAVKSAKAIANPGSNRKFSPSDGIYLFSIPGLNGTAPTQWAKWTDDGINIQAAHGNTLTSDSTGWTFVGPVNFSNAVTAQQTVDVKGAVTMEQTVDMKGVATVETSMLLQGSLQLQGNILSISGGRYTGSFSTSGNVTADGGVNGNAGVSLNAHHHVAPAGGGNTGPAI